MGPAYQGIPQALERGRYQNPTCPKEAPILRGHGIMHQTIFQWLGQQPKNLMYFTEFLKVHAGKGDWLDTPLGDSLIAASKTSDPGKALFVDVGGSTGQACVDLASKLGPIAGRIINQDLAEVILNKIEFSGVEHQAHNFFDEQPIHGKPELRNT